MLDREHYEQIKWIVAMNELQNPARRGGFAYQKPKSSSMVHVHQRVSGLHLGLRAVQIDGLLRWLDDIDLDLAKINQLEFDLDRSLLPDIGVRYEEFMLSPLSTTVHTALEFMNTHSDREPIIFKNDYWYYSEVIRKQISDLSEIHEKSLLIISVPFFENFKVKNDMDDIMKRCCDLGVPVMLDLIWMPLSEDRISLKHTDCVEIVTHSITKTIPISGIKGGLCFWRSPCPQRHNTYPLGGNVGFYLTKKYLTDLGYYHTRDTVAPLRDKWCGILGLEKSSNVLVGEMDEKHPLRDQSLHSKRIPESSLLNLIPFIENDAIITKYLQDNNLLDN